MVSVLSIDLLITTLSTPRHLIRKNVSTHLMANILLALLSTNIGLNSSKLCCDFGALRNEL